MITPDRTGILLPVRFFLGLAPQSLPPHTRPLAESFCKKLIFLKKVSNIF